MYVQIVPPLIKSFIWTLTTSSTELSRLHFPFPPFPFSFPSDFPSFHSMLPRSSGFPFRTSRTESKLFFRNLDFTTALNIANTRDRKDNKRNSRATGILPILIEFPKILQSWVSLHAKVEVFPSRSFGLGIWSD